MDTPAKLQIGLENGIITICGAGDIIYQPGALLARNGQFTSAPLPVRPGRWHNWLSRALEPDRFQLRRGQFDGKFWLGGDNALGAAAILFPDPALGDLYLSTKLVLCYETARRVGGTNQRLIPASTRGAFSVTILKATGEMPIFWAGGAGCTVAEIGEGETLSVNPYALGAWQAKTPPKSFVAKLRLRDLILPRVPQEITLTFTGPAKVWLRMPLGDKKLSKKN